MIVINAITWRSTCVYLGMRPQAVYCLIRPVLWRHCRLQPLCRFKRCRVIYSIEINDMLSVSMIPHGYVSSAWNGTRVNVCLSVYRSAWLCVCLSVFLTVCMYVQGRIQEFLKRGSGSSERQVRRNFQTDNPKKGNTWKHHVCMYNVCMYNVCIYNVCMYACMHVLYVYM